MSARRFGLDYREQATLRDGSPVNFRLVRPDDKALLSDGLGRMSPESRFRRFFSHRDHLSAAELAYLTELDQERHFALGALRPEAIGPDGLGERGLGVARFVVVGDTPDGARIAEAAIAVVDDVQGLGLGRMLFERLVAAAAERGVREFRFDVLADNDTMLGLVKSLFPTASSEVDEGIMTIDCPLPTAHPDPESPHESALYRMLKLAAAGAIKILRGAREIDAMSAVLKTDAKGERDLDELIGLTDEDGPAP